MSFIKNLFKKRESKYRIIARKNRFTGETDYYCIEEYKHFDWLYVTGSNSETLSEASAKMSQLLTNTIFQDKVIKEF